MPNFLKAIIMSAIAFASVYYLTGNPTMAVALSLIPLLLGLVRVMHGFAYSLAALCLIGAVAWSVAPVETKTMVRAEVEKTGVKITAP
ncbi:hypothetical protein [Methylobacterium sp. Leaf93]|uniref:hypothetical protein n=1 Tax=Methylobacterium sp. Leaf93 TaxID=1736249 RepID=UPI0006F250D8|nr:hypothetical protein [Methylobacterium sp. Leaf93]KQP00987.1 hypothetical protein ASF26_15585 [Methylobacterium sp. Leaf93]